MISKDLLLKSTISGIIATIFAILSVYLVHLLGVPFTTFKETMIAVIITAFASGFCGFYFGKRK